MAIYASLVHGLDLELWGAFGFSHERVRDNLARELKSGDWVLSIGTMGEPTPENLRGRLLALMQLGRRQVVTQDYVEPNHWNEHLASNGGYPRWPYGLPIVAAEVFDNLLPYKDVIIPRFRDQNLHMKLASNYEKLSADEERRVLQLPRTLAPLIYSAHNSSFQANLLPRRPGPKPSSSVRTLTPKSGPAATYVMRLEGELAASLFPKSLGGAILKGGFSNDPSRRLAEVNSFYPAPAKLRWKLEWQQWHKDELNAYALEQEFFRQLGLYGFQNVKGEIYVGNERQLSSAWTTAIGLARRPTAAVPRPQIYESYLDDGLYSAP